MANQDHLAILKQGVEVWNQWTEDNPKIAPDLGETNLSLTYRLNNANLSAANLIKSDLSLVLLRGANLRMASLIWADLHGAILYGADLTGAELGEANLSGTNLVNANLSGADCRKANLTGANLSHANLSGADLEGADLTMANLSNANLSGADLTKASLVETNLEGTDLTNCRVYGISVWNLKGKPKEYSNLIITPNHEPAITVDNLEVAQFIYLLLNNQKVRDVIHTIGQKGVLILGRFSPPERKEVLDKIRERVRQLGYLPMMFDFERASEKDFTETIKILAGLSLFVIVDLTNPKSAPLELQATIPDYKIPFVPIIQKGETPFSMFKDLTAYPWVIKPVMSYDSKETLVAMLESTIIKPAIKKHNELVHVKAKDLEVEDIRNFSSEE